MRVWRICRAKWSQSAFSGEGARRAGGRWNHKGTRMVYTSTTLSLAALELFVHLDSEELPTDLVAVELILPTDVSSREIHAAALPQNWRAFPAPASLKEIGTTWAKTSDTLILNVPSAIIPRETNVLINPAHPEFSRIEPGTAEPFQYDPRMWK